MRFYFMQVFILDKNAFCSIRAVLRNHVNYAVWFVSGLVKK